MGIFTKSLSQNPIRNFHNSERPHSSLVGFKPFCLRRFLTLYASTKFGTFQ
ncbi:hypothetical protein LEP1GSC039_1737 [Leptospira santarosai str. 2000027870]|nr:hypothetical protein LEP1GSC039_1737 [Leptospira santarosai str. 2000027870]